MAGFFGKAKAQSWAEWFKQKKTQKKYLLQQIAALQVYADYAYKGYQIVDSGLQTVKDITNGEFKLHNLFITSLKQVSPALRNDARVGEIIILQLAIIKAFGGIKGKHILGAEHLAYLTEVSGNVVAGCLDDLQQLLLTISSAKLEMTDDQRLQRLDRIYQSMLDRSAFAQSFCNNLAQFIRMRQNEQKETEELIHWFNLIP
ncbi:hypothetical protein DBR43_09715 [Pedobacter sp. KBW06]|uniref:hypothetical protein n=1 Tax=Pedobacter sp. KBW06 TaxID=2153359 RepID=UPI000F5AFABD|nr:hypothetical protein [Pedobacter sp. KBW06]RQO75604.1 hypothetical protein DBR43_09715 [Pedobacter sp. KBW06]